jgi:protocatechuate 3,4-dioxygenase beta subunit
MSNRNPLARRRRQLLLGAGAAVLAMPVWTATARTLAPMTDGPFYPPRAWREQWSDWDADLSRVQREGRVLLARGEILGLDLQLTDTHGQRIDHADVEIWQCDALQAYRHPGVATVAGSFDAGFQGFGASRSDAQGGVRFRTIKPVPYPGRTPHIHVKLRHASFGELSSQLFIEGDAGNARDFLWRSLDETDRDQLAMRLLPASADSGLRWQVRHALRVPA